MKKLHFILSAALLTLVGCTQQELLEQNIQTTASEIFESQQKLIEIASDFLNQPVSANAAVTQLICTQSRSGGNAGVYVVNDTTNHSFAMISEYGEEPRVVAFSKDNCFDTSDTESYSAIYDCFVSRLPYLSEEPTSSFDPIYPPIKDNDTTYFSLDIMKLKPWAQDNALLTTYVHKVYPNSPVGCVNLACGRAILYAKDSFTISGKTYNLKKIRHDIYNLENTPLTIVNTITPSLHASPDNLIDSVSRVLLDLYYQAMELAGEYMFEFGQSISSNYHDGATSAKPTKALNKMSELGFNIISNNGEQIDYTLDGVYDCIVNNAIVCIGGNRLEAPTENGHSWIIDGAISVWRYVTISSVVGTNVSKFPKQFKYVHCDWGSGNKDNNNGYYDGDVFKSRDYYNWFNMKYFGINLEREEF